MNILMLSSILPYPATRGGTQVRYTLLEVALHRDKQGVSLDGYLEDCAYEAIFSGV